MHYFLINPNNSLKHLPDFQLFRSEQKVRQGNTFDGMFFMPERKDPDHFSCSSPGGQLPSPFLVANEEARVFDCAANSINMGAGGVLLTGIILREHNAPEKAMVLEAIAKAVADLHAAA